MISQKVRIVSEGRGGTITFKLPQVIDHNKQHANEQSTSLVGTYGCLTCVGIYLKLDRDRAFIAHVQAHKDKTNEEPSAYLSESDGRKLKGTILDKLRREAKEHEWEWDQVNKKSLILACQAPKDTTLFPSAGRWIIAAVQEFLDIDDTCDAEPFGAFIVDHEKLEIIERQEARLWETHPPAFDKFNLFVEDVDDWRFVVGGE